MGFVAPLAMAIGAIASTVQTISSLKRKDTPAAAPAAPAAPTMQNAQTDAKAEVEKRRRISLLSGGNTDVTRGQAALQSGQVGTKSLLGQ